MKKPVILVGGGGHARVLADALMLTKIKIVGFVDQAKKEMTVAGRSIPYLGGDSILESGEYAKKALLVNGIGSTGKTGKREAIFEWCRGKGYLFATVVHPSAVVAVDVLLFEGAQVMAGAVIQTGAKIGRNSIVNTRASVDHDCIIEDHVHVAPGAILCGDVRIGEGSHVGAGATVIQGIIVASRTLVRAQTLVKKPVK